MLFAAVVVLVAMFTFAEPASALLPPGGTFIDDDGSIHEGSIEAVAGEGITKGCNPPFNDAFCPDASITRGQMAAFLRRALEGTLPEGDPIAFVDTAGSIFADDIAWLSSTGITRGCNPPVNDEYCPTSKVKRDQMAAFLRRALEGTLPEGDPIAFVDTAGSIFADDIAWLSSTGITRGCNPPANDEYCPADEVSREQMATFLTRALGLTPTVPQPRGDLALVPVVGAYTQPTHVTAPIGDDRLFIVEKRGTIRIVDDGAVLSTPFLDVSPFVVNAGEKGLLSMAFHPDYATNGRFFVYHSGDGPGEDHTSYVVEYRVSGDPDVADPTSRRVVIDIDQPRSNHNGGHVLFGPDGYLYISLGDGGGSGDPFENGQDPSTLLGSILRIDVDGDLPYSVPATNPYVGAPGADEVWLTGVRNPWRLWFDGGSLFVADVGQNEREEVTVIPDDAGGLDLGWNTLEGTRCYPSGGSCASGGTVLPSLEYNHDAGCSITGGPVYQGAIPELRDWYFYADLCRSWIKAARFVGGKLVDTWDLTSVLSPPGGAWSFGVDGRGEMYAVYGSSGRVYAFVSE